MVFLRDNYLLAGYLIREREEALPPGAWAAQTCGCPCKLAASGAPACSGAPLRHPLLHMHTSLLPHIQMQAWRGHPGAVIGLWHRSR